VPDKDAPAVVTFGMAESWTPEQMEKFRAEFGRAMAGSAPYRWLPPSPAPDVNMMAQVLAHVHGSFSLHFDALMNPAAPDYAPWTLALDGGDQAWGALTAEEAIGLAASELAAAAQGRTGD